MWLLASAWAPAVIYDITVGATYLRAAQAHQASLRLRLVQGLRLMKRGHVGRMQVTAGRDANELGPAAASVALVAGLALSALFLALQKPSLSSPAMRLKADMLDSLHGPLVRNQQLCGRSCAERSCAYGALAVRLLCHTAVVKCPPMHLSGLQAGRPANALIKPCCLVNDLYGTFQFALAYAVLVHTSIPCSCIARVCCPGQLMPGTLRCCAETCLNACAHRLIDL